MERWSTDFELLYQNSEACNENFLQYKLKERDNLVNSVDTLELNEQIRYEEVKKVVDLARNGKAVGIDLIPNEALKNAKVINLLYVLFYNLFENGQIPTVWRNSIIHPIPKGSTKVIRPLLFHGLALQSCIYKL